MRSHGGLLSSWFIVTVASFQAQRRRSSQNEFGHDSVIRIPSARWPRVLSGPPGVCLDEDPCTLPPLFCLLLPDRQQLGLTFYSTLMPTSFDIYIF